MITEKRQKNVGPFFTATRSGRSAKRKVWNMFEANSDSKKDSDGSNESAFDADMEGTKGSGEAEKGLGTRENPRVLIKNDVGDLIGALNNGASIEVTGNAGSYAGDGMTAGELTVDGNVVDCAGNAMTGGMILIRGNAGDYVGQSLKGGTIIIGGDIGDFAGAFMVSGVILVCGSAGRHVGNSMIGGTIFVRGRCRSIELAAEQQRVTTEDRELVSRLSAKYKLDLPMKGLKKIRSKSESPI